MNVYTLALICAVTAAVLGGLEYCVCSRTDRLVLRLAALLYGIIWCVLGVLCYVFRWFGGGWLDLSGFIGMVLFVYGVWSLLSVLAGYLIWHVRNRHGRS